MKSEFSSWLFGAVAHSRSGVIDVVTVFGFEVFARVAHRKQLFGLLTWGRI